MRVALASLLVSLSFISAGCTEALTYANKSREEGIKGSITTGKLADFAVLADDPHTVDPDKIKDIAIARTVTGGKTVYQA